jgi:ankyrin repeat protein
MAAASGHDAGTAALQSSSALIAVMPLCHTNPKPLAVLLLLSRRADPNAKNALGLTAADVACKVCDNIYSAAA